jgi:hypothetical protein
VGKLNWSIRVFSMIAFSLTCVRAADDPPKPEADALPAEGKAEEPKKEEAKSDEAKTAAAKKQGALQSAMKKLAIERRLAQRRIAVERAVLKEDWDKALAGLDEIIGDKEIEKDDLVQAMFDKFIVLAEEKHDGAKACRLAKELGKLVKDDSNMLNELSWTILDTENLKDRDLDAALALAELANQATQGQSGEILDTLARAYYEKGDFDKAVEVQTQAAKKLRADVETADDVQQEVRSTLEKYKAKQAEKRNEAQKRK